MRVLKSFYIFICLPFFFLINVIIYELFPHEKFTLLLLLGYGTILMSINFYQTLSVKIVNLFILFSFSYIIPIFYYSFSNKIITSYNHSNSIELLSKYLLLYNLFFTIIYFFIYRKYPEKYKIEKKNNFLIFYFNIIICLLIAFFSKSGENIFSSGGYGQSEINNLGGFAIGEYFLIFFLIAFKFSGKSKTHNKILLSVGFIYILESLAFGLRNELIQLSILIFFLYYKEKGKNSLYILFIVFGLYFSSLFSILRSDPRSFFQNSIVENLSIKNLFNNNNDTYISHQGDVVHSSSRLINFRDNNLVSNSIIYSSSLLFFSSSLIPQKFLPEQANMAAYKQDEFPVGGGGNIFAYFYFWFSYLGVIFIAIFIGMVLKYFPKYINTQYSAYFVLVLVTFPRWFSYTPINLFKLTVYGLIIYFFFTIIDKEIKKQFKTYKYE